MGFLRSKLRVARRSGAAVEWAAIEVSAAVEDLSGARLSVAKGPDRKKGTGFLRGGDYLFGIFFYMGVPLYPVGPYWFLYTS